jgi:hypothetical protein
MLNVTYKPFVLSIFRLSVVMMNIVMLNVVAPFNVINSCISHSWLPTASNQNGSTSFCLKTFDQPTPDCTGETLQRSIVATVGVKCLSIKRRRANKKSVFWSGPNLVLHRIWGQPCKSFYGYILWLCIKITFVPGMPFQPCLIFAGEARSLPYSGAPSRCFNR